MGRKSKRTREIAKLVDAEKAYGVDEAVALLQQCPPVKFDQSVEIALKMGLDPRKADQTIRGTVSLPNGTGRTTVVVALVSGEKVDEALEAGADFAGGQELCDKIRGGWTAFDAVVASPDMMREVGKLGKVLGPRGLMPTPKAGTVTPDVAKAVSELKAGRVEFKLDRHGVVSLAVGKISFAGEQLKENILALVNAIHRAKPTGAKGQYMQSVALSSTMGPGLKIDLRDLEAKS